MGKLKSTKYVVKFDILKTEQVAAAQQGFDGRALGQMAGLLGAFCGSRGGARAGAVGGTASARCRPASRPACGSSACATRSSTPRRPSRSRHGYTEEKMEVGAKSTSVLGVSQSQQGGVSLDTMVQRLVQKSVWEIDSKYK